MWYWHAWTGFVVLAVILFIGSIIDARREIDELKPKTIKKG